MSLIASILGLFGCSKNNSKDSWTVATGEDNGKPMIVRLRSNIPDGVDIKNYPHLLGISWEYEPARENGMPSETDHERMVLLEKLLDALEIQKTAYMTVAVTCNGVKEWHWYSKNTDETIQLMNTALSEQAKFPIKILIEEDPAWSVYLRFKNGAK
jgi:hypothetical protein